MNDLFYGIFDWVKDDFKSHPVRFVVEFCAWTLSISCSVIMALTVPHPPLFILYPMWIVGCSMYAWASFTRRSFGLLGNYILLASIDTIGFIRILS